MKPCRALSSIVIGLILFSQNGSSTFLAGTLLTGFMGGFLVGKITLGTFLTVLSQVNQPQPAGTGSTSTPAKVTTRFNEINGGIQNIPNSVDSKVRDRFLRQLGKMDPLKCLPKVFCEISSDPEAAANIFGKESPFPFAFNGQSNSDSLQSFKGQKSKKKQGSKPSQNYDEEQDDTENDYDESDSQSDEDDVEQEEEDLLLKAYEKKDAQNIETKALEEMIEESDDPLNYYFILKDKKKNVHPELYGLIENGDSQRSLGSNSGPDTISKRMGEATDSSIEIASAPRKRPSRKTSSPVDDIFAADPFFDEFSRSLKFTSTDDTFERVSNVGQLRRSKRQVVDEDDIMSQYRMAARIAEKYKNPSKCRRIFYTCPFSAEEVMGMINEMNSTPDSMNTKKVNSMKNLENTLLAIEKLNTATLLAKSSGKPVDYGKVMEEALQSQDTGSSTTSTKIMRDFEGLADQMEVQNSKQKLLKSKKTKPKPNSIKRPKNKQSVRRRRHGEMPPSVLPETRHESTKRRESRISLSGNRGRKSENSRVSMTPSTNGEDIKPILLVEKLVEKLESNESEEKVQSSIEPKVHVLGDVVVDTPSTLDEVKDAELRIYKSDEGEEDDEAASVGSEQPFKVPTFSQTYVDTLQSPSKVKSRPRPVYPVVKIKPYIKRTTTPATGTPTTTARSRRPTPVLTQKFSGELEDDEEEAKNSEDAIDVIISKYKPKDKKSKP